MRCPDAMVLASLSRRTGLLVLVAAISLCVASAQPLPPPEVAARAYLLMDVSANQVLAAKDVDLPVEPASLYQVDDSLPGVQCVAQQAVGPAANLPVSERAWKMGVAACSLTPACWCR